MYSYPKPKEGQPPPNAMYSYPKPKEGQPPEPTGEPVSGAVVCYQPPSPAVVVQAQAPKAEWSTGLCDCFDDCENCCVTCLCPCITFRQIVDRGSTSCGASGSLYTLIMLTGTGCQCVYSCFYRAKMRAQYGLRDTVPPRDCCVHCCCEPCALCQEYRGLKMVL